MISMHESLRSQTDRIRFFSISLYKHTINVQLKNNIIDFLENVY